MKNKKIKISAIIAAVLIAGGAISVSGGESSAHDLSSPIKSNANPSASIVKSVQVKTAEVSKVEEIVVSKAKERAAAEVTETQAVSCWLDNDGDGICDNLGNAGCSHTAGAGNGAGGGNGAGAGNGGGGGNWVDADGDGICDNVGSGAGGGNGAGAGNGGNWVDADGDGACDNAGSGAGGGNGAGAGNGGGRGAGGGGGRGGRW